VKAGKNAAAAFKEGDRIGSVSFLGICGECDSCKNINPKYCTNLKGALGITHNGAFSEYAVVDYKSCAKLPDSMSFEQAAPLCCAGTTIFVGIRKAARVANLKEGRVRVSRSGGTKLIVLQAIGIIGLGALGLLGVQMAKAMVGCPAADLRFRAESSAGLQSHRRGRAQGAYPAGQGP
jgi:propanol-preferring alcohol dehydrogenase